MQLRVNTLYTGVNAVTVKCRGPGIDGIVEHLVTAVGYVSKNSEWGDFAGGCEVGTAVCAVKTKVNHDRTPVTGVNGQGLTGAMMQCCDY